MDQPKRATRLNRAEKKEVTRRALMDAAARVFAERGFHGTSIDAVAEEAGFTKGAVYSHFGSKEELYLSLLDERLGSELGGWVNIIETGVSIPSVLDEVQQGFIDEIKHNRSWGILTLEFTLHAMRDETIRARLAERIARGRIDYEQSLAKRYAATGKAPPMPLNQLAAALLAFENGLSLLALLDSTTEWAPAYGSVLSTLLG
jgi:AcrR family transcriptional regulator